MSVKLRIILTAILTSFAFWIPIWLPFAETKGIPISQSYALISIYSILVVIFEYPTGVIGDTISHKLSTLLGYLLTMGGYALMLFINGYTGMLISLVIVALGTSMISGSDQAYWHSILPDFRKHYPNIKTAGMAATLVGITSGAILYTFNTNLPVFLNVLAFLVASIIFITMPKENREEFSEKGNPFAVAKKGLSYIKKTSSLLVLLSIGAILYSFSSNLKWLYSNIFEVVNIDTFWWGMLIALFFLARFVGVQISQKLKLVKISTTALLLALANFVFLMGFILHPLFIILMVIASMIIIGMVETELELQTIESSPSNIRASILSFKGLLGRLAAALYIFVASNVASKDSLYKVTTLTFAFFLFGIGLNIYRETKKKNL